MSFMNIVHVNKSRTFCASMEHYVLDLFIVNEEKAKGRWKNWTRNGVEWGKLTLNECTIYYCDRSTTLFSFINISFDAFAV